MHEHTKCLGIPTPLYANKRLHLVGAPQIGTSSISLSRRARSTSTTPHLGQSKAFINDTFRSAPEKDFAPTTGLKRLLCSPATCKAEEEVCLNLVCLFSCCCGRDTNPTQSHSRIMCSSPAATATADNDENYYYTGSDDHNDNEMPPKNPPTAATAAKAKNTTTWTTSPNASRARG